MFGAGFALKKFLYDFENHGIKIAGICDNNPLKQGTLINDQYEIMSLEKSLTVFPGALYVISSPKYFHEIKKNLEEVVGEKFVCDIDFECNHYFNGTAFKFFVKDHLKRFEHILSVLEDDISKKTFYQVIKAQISGEYRDFEDAFTGADDWYLYKSLLKPDKDSTYLDCGAFDGDTLALFSQSAINGYKHIWAFEPDISVQQKLKETISKNNIENVTIILKGAYDSTGQMRFTKDGFYSSIVGSNTSISSKPGSETIEVTTIDTFFNGERLDIIKMDIEGSELKALAGATNTIKQYKPRLAICLYHNISDFLHIPEFLLSIVPEYHLYVRHQSKSCTDTILFAVP
jgi:FkbM family methyltransferase